MERSLLDKLVFRWPVARWRGMTIVVGCSGGADSTALLLALHELCPAESTLVVAHYNHRLRGAESDADEAFVASLARRLQCPFHSRSAPSESRIALPRMTEASPSTFDEASLRQARYGFLQRTADHCGARYVAVAHTADDSVETSLHNLCRGTGLKGMAGIPPYRNLHDDLVLIRPLIDAWRSEVEDYLAERGQDFRTDSSNRSTRYTRNRIRHELLPSMERLFGADTRTAIHRATLHLQDVQRWIGWEAERWIGQKVVERTTEGLRLRLAEEDRERWPVVQFALSQLWHLQNWPLMEFTASHWGRIRTLLAQVPSHEGLDLPGRVRLECLGSEWRFERRVVSPET